ncbi:MAG: PDDEXK nuclease domain-containing protein, partial [Terriglobales bacterium]
LGTPHKAFAASAVLASDNFTLSAAEQVQLSHDMEFYRAPYGVRLQETNIWNRPCRVDDVLSQLTFIENKDNWGVYFQGGVRYLPERDFEIITNCAVSPSPGLLEPNLHQISSTITQSEFALETHLEEFIDKNWNHINFGRQLNRYATDEENGRQFPAGQWSIDFLCTDTESGSLVILELKKGQTSDATVGQILRYIAWVEEKIAKKDQRVEGIIIAKEVDEALRYAVKNLPHIKVLTYQVDFTLHKPVALKSAVSSLA